MCTILGYGLPGRETYCMLSIGEAFVFLRFSTFSSLARFPLLTHSGINYPPSAQQMVHPFSPERSFVLQAFLFLAFVFLPFIRRNSSSLLQSHWIAQPQAAGLLSKNKVLSLLATSLLNRNPYGFPINGSPVF